MGGGWWYVTRMAVLAMLYLEDGQADRANHLLDTALRSPRPDAGLNVLCLALAQAGRIDDLENIRAELVSEFGPNWFPGRYEMHLAAHELDEAFRFLNEGIEQRYPSEVMWLRADVPWLAPLREDARWSQVLEHLEDMEARAATGE